jgi:hypothetical protein
MTQDPNKFRLMATSQQERYRKEREASIAASPYLQSLREAARLFNEQKERESN